VGRRVVANPVQYSQKPEMPKTELEILRRKIESINSSALTKQNYNFEITFEISNNQ